MVAVAAIEARWHCKGPKIPTAQCIGRVEYLSVTGGGEWNPRINPALPGIP